MEDGGLFVWGRNDHGQLGASLPALVTLPRRPHDLEGCKVKAVCTSASQTTISATTSLWNVPQRAAFVIGVSKATFEKLDELIGRSCEGFEFNDWPPTQENECLATAALNLMSLQV